ncbi:flagellar basal body P-ring protein FlgI [Rubrivirga sp. S365]|uniref:flagellar basal body P-ring protein FlgI n=1 Tax=Rubrivirga sp. S365 TaxID=3076080 RepID=UPI0028C727FE|nr:flagellar basal body P-ring protein FlgI [Rubrivirga sp. S365]MDT7856063.1 flagellar basal body P-ring protein FlgI [Rubrivirga sp. S365]
MRFLLLLLAIALAAPPAGAQPAGQPAAAPRPGGAAASARLKDLVVLEGAAPVQLVGYGLIVGLDRTGDRARGRSSAPYTVQSIANMLRRFGTTVDPLRLGARNAAAVMVTATLDPFSGPGGRLDVTVSAIGDATSLSGGTLIQTPLLDPLTNLPRVVAQGAVSTGTLLASAAGSSARTGPTNTGRVPGGGLVVEAVSPTLDGTTAGLILRTPDFTNAARVAEAVNARFPAAAEAVHAGLVRVAVPEGGVVALMASLESLQIAVDVPARVVVNERTGTIVAGGDVRISEAMITYGSLVISTQVDPVVSQPGPFSDGQTVAAAVGGVAIDEAQARSVLLPPNADVGELAAALDALGMTARDVIAVFQALSRAGALQGELVIL